MDRKTVERVRVNTYSKPSQGGYNETINTQRSKHNEAFYPGLSHRHRHRPHAVILSVL
jgi:hypothetical protein